MPEIEKKILLSELPATSCEPRQSDATKKNRAAAEIVRRQVVRHLSKSPPQRGMS